jgi:adenosine/AMP kinase
MGCKKGILQDGPHFIATVRDQNGNKREFTPKVLAIEFVSRPCQCMIRISGSSDDLRWICVAKTKIIDHRRQPFG